MSQHHRASITFTEISKKSSITSTSARPAENDLAGAIYLGMLLRSEKTSPVTAALLKERAAWTNIPFSADGNPLPWTTSFECDDGHPSTRWTENTAADGEGACCPICDNELEGTNCGQSTSRWSGPQDPLEMALWELLTQ